MAQEPREGRIRAHDPELRVEHGLADRRVIERRPQQRLGPLQRAPALLELDEHATLERSSSASNGFST